MSRFTLPSIPRVLPALLAAQLVSTLLPSTSEACGGLFCSAATPVNQAAERIVFAQDEAGTITQIVEIQYEGPAERFAWVLPVPGVPEFDVSSSIVFDRLQQATNPTYRLNDTMPGACGGFPTADSAGAGTGGATGNDGNGPVTVLAAGSVGPFNYEVISVDAADDDPAQAAIEWLGDNEYDVGALGPSVLGPYLANGLNLLAFRLQKGVDTGAIQPVSLKYEASVPAIPIRPTAVAANDDMGIMVWLLGPARGVPTNYKGLELNELYIDWFNPNDNYNEVVSLAANEAGGQGFVTEFAGPAERFHDVVDPGFESLQPSDLSGATMDAALQQIANQYGAYDGFTRVFGEHVTLREPLTVDDFLLCSSCYFYPENNWTDVDYGTYDSATDPTSDTDLDALVAAIDQEVLRPIREAADLFIDHPYLTRLYTTMSASEMDVDPTFDFNADLDPVDNVHVAERQLTCDGPAGPWRVTLADGRKVYGEGNTWPITIGENDDLPFNARVLSFGASGSPEVDIDNSPRIADAFATLEASRPNRVDARSGGCSVGGAHSSHTAHPSHTVAWLLLALGALGARALRRRTLA